MNRELLILIGGRAVQALLSIAALRVMTSYLSPSEAGNYFLLLSFATGFSFLLINPVGMYINRRLHAWQQRGVILDRLAVFNFYLLGVAALALLATAALKTFIGSAPGVPVWAFSLFVAAYVFLSTWNMTLVPALNMLGHRLYFVVLTVLTTGLGLGLSLLAVRAVRADALSWIGGQAAAMMLVALAALVSLKKLTAEHFSGHSAAAGAADRASFLGVRDFALPLAGATVFMWLQSQGYRLIVEARAGADFLGFLGVGLGIAASLAAVAESLVQQVYFPGFYRRINSEAVQERSGALSDLAAKALPVYIVLLFFTAALAPQLAGLLVHGKFSGAAPFIAFGAVIELFRMTANILSSAAHSEMRTKLLIKPYAYGGAVLCAGAYAAAGTEARGLLIPVAMAAGGLITLLVMWRQSARAIRVRLDWLTLAKTAVFSSPLALFFAAKARTSAAESFFLLLAAGAYCVWVLYLATFKWAAGHAPDLKSGELAGKGAGGVI